MARAKIMVSIPEEMVADLNQAAKEEHRSRSEFIREAVQLYIQVRKSRTIPGQVPQVRKAIAIQDALVAADTAGGWDGTYEVRKWRESR
jgi:CopG family transcriptional regulator / antitoxin EndoAI